MSEASQREEAIFEAALKLPADKRNAFLTEACAGDETLRERIAALLGAFDRATGFMSEPATPVRSTSETSVSEKPGDCIGRYKLLEQIGEGGCGVVYVAEQEEPVRRRVALKVIKLGMDTKQVIARFDAERQALAMMDHPNIAKVLEAGATDTGRPYFVMELVRGVKITDYCDQNHLPPRARLDLFTQVCRAIQHAHQKGVIHRDIKPSNILVTLHDGMPVPKVIDFGIAKATQGRLTDQTVYTAFEQFIGTPAYMSPEQAEMSGLDIDTRSDIYSLGVLLYELLTGATPFDAKELLSKGLDEMRRTIREVEPVKPSTRLTQELVGDDVRSLKSNAKNRDPKTEEKVRGSRRLLQEVRGDLDWIVMKCLEKDRTRRYETANGLAIDINRHLSNEPIVARPPSQLYRFQKSVQRNKLAFAAATAVALALIIGLVVSTAMFFKAQAEKKKAQTEAAKSERVAKFLKDTLEGIDLSVTKGRDTTLLRELLDSTAERVGKDLARQPEVEAELRETIGTIYYQIGPIEKAEAMQRAELAIRKELSGDHRLDVARTLSRLGLTLWKRERLGEAESVLRESMALQTNSLGVANRRVLETFMWLGGVLTSEGKLEESEATLRRALLVSKRMTGDGDWKLAWPLRHLGQTLEAEGKLTEAEQILREAVAADKKAVGDEHFWTAVSLRFLGSTLLRAGNLTEAESVLRDAAATFRKVSDPQRNADLAWTLDLLDGVYRAQGHRVEAEEEVLRESLAIKHIVLGDQNANTSETLNYLIQLLRQEGKEAEAKLLIEGQSATATEKKVHPR